jgi:hypothetical protein
VPKVDARFVPGPAPVRSDPGQCSWPNAGNTENPALPPSGGDNVSGAVNQQERPLAAEWVVGFVDGEGCFSVPIFRNKSCRSGWQVQPEFAAVQGERSVSVLYAPKNSLGVAPCRPIAGRTTIVKTCGATASDVLEICRTASYRFRSVPAQNG